MTIHNRSIALAGCIQHAWWAHRLAQYGEFREERLGSAANGILCTDPAQALDVYGSLESLKEGIGISMAILGKDQSESISVQEITLLTRYVGQVLKLGATLLTDSSAMDKLAARIENLKTDKDAAANTDQVPVSELATVYVENISPLKPRIMIQGNGIYLHNEEFAAGIRTHLLAAIRSAVLWRQCGGKLWHLLFQRSAYLSEISRLAHAIDTRA